MFELYFYHFKDCKWLARTYKFKTAKGLFRRIVDLSQRDDAVYFVVYSVFEKKFYRVVCGKDFYSYLDWLKKEIA